MIKRVFAVLLSAVFLLTLSPKESLSDGIDVSALDEKYVLLVNADDPTTALYGVEKAADTRCYPASTTKILTCIVALENGSLDDAVSISAAACDFSKYNSLMGLAEGESYTLRDLLYGLMLVSGNDAAIAVAEAIGGSVDGFVSLMNTKAQELGMSSSHFVSPHGKHNDEHYTTARDMAVLTAYALKNSDFCDIVGAKSYTASELGSGKTIPLTNANRLLVDATGDGFTPISCLYEYAIGVKTGDTDQAGKCLIAAAQQGGVTLIAVLLGGTGTTIDQKASEKDPYNARRFQDAINLFDYAFGQMLEQITVADLVQLGMPLQFTVQLANYAADDAQAGLLTATANLDTTQSLRLMSPYMTQLKAAVGELATTRFTVSSAPVKQGDTVGSVEYAYNGMVLFTADLIADRAVNEGLISTETAVVTDGGGLSIGSPTGLNGSGSNSSADDTQSKGGTSWLLVVLLIVVLLVIFFFMICLILRAKRRREQERRRAAALRRRREAEARRRETERSFDAYRHRE